MKTASSTTVLGKRRHSRLVLRLSSSPLSDAPITETPTSIQPIPLKVSKKSRYPCTHSGCTRSYSKPSRLEEHQRSHTGERPFACDTCGKSYLRESHLQTHSRCHLPESERPYVCTESAECNKRFWTFQHLVLHENSHRGNKSYTCPELDCGGVFAKHHQLRAHICEAHSPPGTKPYICSHAGCTKSFATNQKLRGHVKIHDGKRYTCSHPDCLPDTDKDLVYFGTWTALQAHLRAIHPPTCMHPKCNKRAFASHHNLRAHLKLHEQQGAEAQLHHADEPNSSMGTTDAEDPRPRKRRRGGELGRDWVCDFAGCCKDFKSKSALTTHRNVIHLGQRDHVCPHSHCNSAFGYKHLLERHLAKLHSSTTAYTETTSEEEASTPFGDAGTDIEAITGKTYATHSQNAKFVHCPYPHVDALVASSAIPDAHGPSSSKTCEHVLTRAYDLRRHLRSEHGVDTEKDKVDAWVKAQRHARTR